MSPVFKIFGFVFGQIGLPRIEYFEFTHIIYLGNVITIRNVIAYVFLFLLNALLTKTLLVSLKHINPSQQKINKVAVVYPVIIIEVVGNIHADNNFFEKVTGEFQRV